MKHFLKQDPLSLKPTIFTQGHLLPKYAFRFSFARKNAKLQLVIRKTSVIVKYTIGNEIALMNKDTDHMLIF